MRVKQRLREQRSELPGTGELEAKAAEGWKLAAVIWEREAQAAGGETRPVEEVVPYGMRVADDCINLVEDQREKDIIMLSLELIVQDYRLSQVAVELNRRNFRTRSGQPWNAASVFELLPRLIDVGPRIFSSQEWAERRQRLFQVLQQ